MSSSQDIHHEDEDFLNVDDAEEVIQQDDDHLMDSDADGDEDNPVSFEDEEINLQNDSLAHFDHHGDSIFCIAQHPFHPSIVITGSGDDTAFIFDSTPLKIRPPLPPSFESDPQPQTERKSLKPLATLDGHSDSVNAVAFTNPRGDYVVTAGLDGRLRVWRDPTAQKTGRNWEFLAESQEVEEINWVAVCPCSDGDEEKSNMIALGASDGSVWVYKVDGSDASQPVSIIQTFFQHTGSCTAGAWTPDGKLLATVSEDGSFYVYDVFGAASAAGIQYSAGTNAVVGYTVDDQRFAVEGGLYSVAIAPTGAFAAVGGAEGHIKVVGLPRLPTSPASLSSKPSSKSKSKSPAAGSKSTAGAPGAGILLASLQAQSESIETLSFSAPPLTLLASGSVDGSITLFDTAHRFAVRRHIREAHEGTAVVKVEFVNDDLPLAGSAARPTASAASSASGQGRSWLLTSVGMDGVVRRWDTRGGTAAAGQGLLKVWRGHAGIPEGEDAPSGGILGFVQSGGGRRIVTAGDEGVALVFEE
jgi:ribosome assembly protein SQT1